MRKSATVKVTDGEAELRKKSTPTVCNEFLRRVSSSKKISTRNIVHDDDHDCIEVDDFMATDEVAAVHQDGQAELTLKEAERWAVRGGSGDYFRTIDKIRVKIANTDDNSGSTTTNSFNDVVGFESAWEDDRIAVGSRFPDHGRRYLRMREMGGGDDMVEREEMRCEWRKQEIGKSERKEIYEEGGAR